MLLRWQQAFPWGKVEMTMKQMSFSSSSYRYLMCLNNSAKERRDWTSFMTLYYRESQVVYPTEKTFFFAFADFTSRRILSVTLFRRQQQLRVRNEDCLSLWRLAFFFPAVFRQLQTLLQLFNIASNLSTGNTHGIMGQTSTGQHFIWLFNLTFIRVTAGFCISNISPSESETTKHAFSYLSYDWISCQRRKMRTVMGEMYDAIKYLNLERRWNRCFWCTSRISLFFIFISILV